MDSNFQETMKNTGAKVVTDQPPPYTPEDPINVQPGAANSPMDTRVNIRVITPAYGQPIIQAHHNGLVTTMVQGMAITGFTTKPATITCESCNTRIVTRCESKLSWKTHFMALTFGLLGFLPCCCMVYCLKDCKNADHYCPECNSYMGSYVF